MIDNGIVFVWVEKTLLSQIIRIMEGKGFRYIENLQVVFLDLKKVKTEFERKLGYSFEVEKDETLSRGRRGDGRAKSR